MLEQTEPNELIENIPHPQQVREKLGALLREVQLLRQLLKVAERAEKNRRERQEVAHA